MRPWIELPGLHLCAQLVCNSLFKSEGIEHTLATAFDKETLLFGSSAGREESDVNKTAVLVTSDDDQQSILLSNYNRERKSDGQSCKPIHLRPTKGY